MEDVVVPGVERTIAYAVAANGRRHAKEFLEGGDVPDKDRAAILHAFRVLAEKGKITNKERFKKEEGAIWGFKSYQTRIGAFQVGRVWYLTHGFIKKRDQWPPTELARAERIRTEHMQRKATRNVRKRR